MLVPDALLTRLNERPHELTDADLVEVETHYGAEMKAFAVERRTNALANSRDPSLAEAKIICQRMNSYPTVRRAMLDDGWMEDEIGALFKWAQNPETVPKSRPRLVQRKKVG